MRCRAICLIICSLLSVKKAAALEVCGSPKQGELLLIKDDLAEKMVVFANSKEHEYTFSPDGTALLALHRDCVQNIELRVYESGKKARIYTLKVEAGKWNVQRVNGVAPHKVIPSPQHQKEIAREYNDVNKALDTRSDYYFWRDGFIAPVEGKISGYFGNQRIFNGVPKSPHSGTDIAAAEGMPVKASGAGMVILNGADYFYTGNMVIIDHGYGLQTIYAHLQKATVKSGDVVKQGDVIGYVGKTGRATGAHLHWGASLYGVRFNPYSLLNLNDKSCRKQNEEYAGE